MEGVQVVGNSQCSVAFCEQNSLFIYVSAADSCKLILVENWNKQCGAVYSGILIVNQEGWGRWVIFSGGSHYYYYTRLTASFPGQPGQAGTRKVEPVWI